VNAMAEFARARIAEESFVAAAAQEADRELEGMGMPIAEPADRFIGEHLALWNPVRMSAEVAAKRAVLDRHGHLLKLRAEHPDDLATAGALLESLRTVGLLVQPWAGQHPDFDPTWRTPE
jgi:hypothetical protein